MDRFFNIAPLEKDSISEWDSFVLSSGDAWFWHSSSWMKYTMNYRPDLKSESLSFFVKDDSGILAVCPLFLENSVTGENFKEFSFGGGFLPFPTFLDTLTAQRRAKLEKFIFAYIDELAEKLNVKRIRLRDTPIRPGFYHRKPPPINFLIKYDFIDCSGTTCILDLRRDDRETLNSMRKGHRYDIKRGRGIYNVRAHHKESATEDIFDKYRQLHYKASGRATRSKETFDLMRRMAMNGHAVLFSAEDEQEIRMFILLLLFKGSAYYGSEADDPDYITEIPIGHMLQWNAINWLKERDFKLYDLGVQHFSHQIFSLPSKKEMSISLFKRGFGGNLLPYHKGEKYYDMDFFYHVFHNRIKTFSGN